MYRVNESLEAGESQDVGLDDTRLFTFLVSTVWCVSADDQRADRREAQ